MVKLELSYMNIVHPEPAEDNLTRSFVSSSVFFILDEQFKHKIPQIVAQE